MMACLYMKHRGKDNGGRRAEGTEDKVVTGKGRCGII